MSEDTQKQRKEVEGSHVGGPSRHLINFILLGSDFIRWNWCKFLQSEQYVENFNNPNIPLCQAPLQEEDRMFWVVSVLGA